MKSFIIAGAMTVLVAAPQSMAQRSGKDAEAVYEAAKGINSFGVQVFSQLRHTEGNLVVSPLSVETLLALIAVGARGATADRLAEVSRLRSESLRADGGFVRLLMSSDTHNADAIGVSLDSAVAVWVGTGVNVREDYRLLVQNSYRGLIQSVDFVGAPEASRGRINSWVAEQTRGQVAQLIPIEQPLAGTRLLLTSAISFKAGWQNPFPQDNTRQTSFRVALGRMVNVPLMRQIVELRTTTVDEAQIVELPYHEGSFSMIIILPKREDGLTDLEDRLAAHGIEPWIRALPHEREELEVFLPRFEVQDRRQLNEPLRALGLGDLFSDEVDLSGLAEPRIPINRILTQSRVRVDEKGTIAAAVTAGFEGRSDPPSFRADHPFIYFIRDNRTGTILFLGRLVEPSNEPY